MNQTMIHDFLSTNFFAEDYFPEGIPVIPVDTHTSPGFGGKHTELSRNVYRLLYGRFDDVLEEDDEDVLLSFIIMQEQGV